jgi:hypothetical protein
MLRRVRPAKTLASQRVTLIRFREWLGKTARKVHVTAVALVVASRYPQSSKGALSSASTNGASRLLSPRSSSDLLRYLITLHAASTPIQSFAAEQIAVLFKIVGCCGGRLLMRDVLAILLLFVFRPCLHAQSPDPEPLSAQFVARSLSLEQRQPLELVYADSIVPQDKHETMLVTGLWYMRHSRDRDALLTQKIEWGISDQLQVSTFIHVVHSSNLTGPTLVGTGDFEVGARYTWANVGSRFTHVAVALDGKNCCIRVGRGENAIPTTPIMLRPTFARVEEQTSSPR